MPVKENKRPKAKAVAKPVAKPVEKIKVGVDKVAHAARAATVPAPVRRYRAVVFQVVLILVAISFGILTFLVKTTPSFALDLQITRAIQTIKFPLFAEFMNVLSWPGFNPQSVIITAVIIVLIYGLGLRWEGVMALVAAVFSAGINVLVKDLIQRPRPTVAVVNVIATLNSYSFPSGHVMFYTGFFGFLWFLAFSLLKPSLKRSLVLVFLGILVALIGVSRIYLGEHWASDVVGAYLLATLTLAAIIVFYRWGKSRFFVNQPVAKPAPSKT